MKTSFAFLLLLLGSASIFMEGATLSHIKWNLGSALTFLKPETKKTNERLLYPYGESVGDMKNPKEDDGTSPGIPISVPFTFYGKTYHIVYVNNNGVVSFSVPVPEYTPKAIPLVDGKAFAAPYWGDCNNLLGGDVYYRQTQSPELLRNVTRDINNYFPEIKFTATWLFIATWDRVAYFGSLSRKVNTFQAILCTDGHMAFMIFNYGDIQWTTGAASQGNPRTGLGGIPAQAGFNSGDDKNYYSIPGSRTPQVFNITKTSNVHVAGRWVFRVDNFIRPATSEEPMPKKEEPEVSQKEEPEISQKEEPEISQKEEPEISQKEEEPEANVTVSGEDLPEKGGGHLNHEDSQEVPEQQSKESSDEDSDHCEW